MEQTAAEQLGPARLCFQDSEVFRALNGYCDSKLISQRRVATLSFSYIIYRFIHLLSHYMAATGHEGALGNVLSIFKFN